MSRSTDKNSKTKSDKSIIENDNDLDSGFLSGCQPSVEISQSDIMPETKTDEINPNEESLFSNVDSGYIDQDASEKLTRAVKLYDNNLTERFKSLSIKTEESKNSKNPEEKSKVTKEKWEVFYQQDDDGDTQLHWACLAGYLDIVAVLIRISPHPCLWDIQNDDAQTALHIAAFSDKPKIIRMLLIAGADPTIQDRNGNTPLHLACMNGNLQCVKAFTEKINMCELKEATEIYLSCKNNIDVNIIINVAASTLLTRNYDGEYCVHLAAQGNYVDILRQLIYSGADINERECKSGHTALHVAIARKNEDVVNFLLEEGAKFNLNLETCTYSGMTAFQFAYILENKTLQHNLEKMGAEVYEFDSSDSDSSDTEYNLENAYLSLAVN